MKTDPKKSPAAQIRQLGGAEILKPSDLPQFWQAENCILRLMRSGRWVRATDIIAASGQREGLRRLRNLRTRGFHIERKRLDSREFAYRIVK